MSELEELMLFAVPFLGPWSAQLWVLGPSAVYALGAQDADMEESMGLENASMDGVLSW